MFDVAFLVLSLGKSNSVSIASGVIVCLFGAHQDIGSGCKMPGALPVSPHCGIVIYSFFLGKCSRETRTVVGNTLKVKENTLGKKKTVQRLKKKIVDLQGGGAIEEDFGSVPEFEFLRVSQSLSL